MTAKRRVLKNGARPLHGQFNTRRVVIALGICLLFVAMMGLWQFSSRFSIPVRLLISSPSRVLSYAEGHSAELFLDVAFTSIESLIGLLLGASIACLTIQLASKVPWMLDWFTTAGQISQALPLISLAPFFIVAFGLGIESKIAMTVLVSFFPILIGLAGALRSLPQDWNDYLSFHGTSPSRRFWFVAARLRLPDLLRSGRISASLSVMGAIVAEFNGAAHGLGRNLFIAAKRLEPELMVVSIVLAVALSLAYYGAIGLVDRLTNRWYWSGVGEHSDRSET